MLRPGPERSVFNEDGKPMEKTVTEVLGEFEPFALRVPACDRYTDEQLTTLQVNVGYRCNLACKHCHLECSPARTESMSREVMQACLDAYETCGFSSVDITGGAPEVRERGRDEGVVHAVEVASEVGVEDGRDDQESEHGQHGVTRTCANLLQRQALDEEGRGGQRGGGEGDQAGLFRGEGESRARPEEERPCAGFPFRAGVQVANARPEHHKKEAGEEHLLDEVRCEEGEEGRRTEQQGEDEAGDEALREAFQGEDAEDKSKDGEHEGRAAQERAVERRRVVVSGRLLDGRRHVVERGAVVVLWLVRVPAGLEEASRGEGLVRLVGMECPIVKHARLPAPVIRC